jgi:hypothetical protein
MFFNIIPGVVLFVHGVIHLLGFIRAFFPGKIKIEGRPVGKKMGLVWLLATLLFLAAFALWLFQLPYWSLVALIAVAVSQFLILVQWKEAKFGTLANIIVLLWAWPHYGGVHFDNMLQSEWDQLKSGVTAPARDTIREEQLAGLPYIVQKWLRQSGAVGKPSVSHAYIRQAGTMLLETGSTQKLGFDGVEYFDVKNPAFIWSTKVNYASWLPLSVRDKWINGEAEMLVKLMNVINVVHEKDNEKMDKAAALRFLGELCWMPAAALEPFIKWELMDSLSAKATIAYQDKTYSGTFTFTKDGKIKTFEAIRLFGNEKGSKEYPWQVEAQEYDYVNGYQIPSRCIVTWILPTGKFTWMEIKVTDLLINRWPDNRL